MNKLTVVIITYNEEENIGRCLDSVKTVADEIVVMDSFSTDRTGEIAQQKGAIFLQHPFDGHIQQKNRVKNHASYDYVLSIDADECLSDSLRQSIAAAKQNFVADGYTMNRLNFYCGKSIKTCGWYPDKKLRLWNRNKGEWTGINPHDKFMLEENASVIHLEGDILHNTYPTLESLALQADKFATIGAHHLQERSRLYLWMKMLFSPLVKFIRNYVWNLGFTDGATGWTICYHQSREVFLKYFRAMKLKEA